LKKKTKFFDCGSRFGWERSAQLIGSEKKSEKRRVADIGGICYGFLREALEKGGKIWQVQGEGQ